MIKCDSTFQNCNPINNNVVGDNNVINLKYYT